jgi:hypothetical protein
MLVSIDPRIGFDVPWVVSWTGESVLGAKPCGHAWGGLAVFQAERPGVGTPKYAQNHFLRQRRSVRQMLCPQCGQPTPNEDRWTLTARRVAAGQLRSEGLDSQVPPDIGDAHVVVDAGGLAPMHHDCARRAMVMCPHLTKGLRLDLRRFTERWVVSPLYVEFDAPEPGHVLLAKSFTPPPVVAFLQLCGLTDEVDKRWRREPVRTKLGATRLARRA